jgi:D-amino-acid dehydrogenase
LKTLDGNRTMTDRSSRPSAPSALRHVVVVGAGLVGLSTAWFLQEHGVEVTVVDRKGVAAGSSWGNAGWISPGIVAPLPEPSVLRYGLKALFDPSAALFVPPRFDPKLWRFLTRFAMNCTMKQWRRAMTGFLEIDAHALEAYDDLASGGVSSPTIEAPLMAAFERDEQATNFRHELAILDQFGQHVETKELSGDEARQVAPHLSQRVGLVLQMNGHRFIDPEAYANSLADAIVARGGKIESGIDVRSISYDATGITVIGGAAQSVRGDAVVIATGAWLSDLVTDVGVRMRVAAGRGYSFSVNTDLSVPNPLYFTAIRIACTPYRGGMRVGGTMEFQAADAPVNLKRVDALVKLAQPMLSGVDWNSMTDVWVGSRPVVADGLPLIGATSNSRTFVAGGHGMFGITLGPITGKLLAEQMVTGVQPTALLAFSPLR